MDLDPEREVMMFRVMFNTAFIRSNILMLNPDNLDILWEAKDHYPKGFRAEVCIFLSISLFYLNVILLDMRNWINFRWLDKDSP